MKIKQGFYLDFLTKKDGRNVRGGIADQTHFVSGTMPSVSDEYDSINERPRTDQQQNKITYFRGVPEVPCMN